MTRYEHIQDLLPVWWRDDTATDDQIEYVAKTAERVDAAIESGDRLGEYSDVELAIAWAWFDANYTAELEDTCLDRDSDEYRDQQGSLLDAMDAIEVELRDRGAFE